MGMEIDRVVPDDRLWPLMRHFTLPAYTHEGLAQPEGVQGQLFPKFIRPKNKPKIKDALATTKRLADILKILTSGSVEKKVNGPDGVLVSEWRQEWAPEDDEFDKKPTRSYKKKFVSTPRTTNTVTKPSRGGRSGSSGSDSSLDSEKLVQLGCFFAMIMIVKMFLRKCRRK